MGKLGGMDGVPGWLSPLREREGALIKVGVLCCIKPGVFALWGARLVFFWGLLTGQSCVLSQLLSGI